VQPDSTAGARYHPNGGSWGVEILVIIQNRMAEETPPRPIPEGCYFMS